MQTNPNPLSEFSGIQKIHKELKDKAITSYKPPFSTISKLK